MKLWIKCFSALQIVFSFFLHENNLRKPLIPLKGLLKRVPFIGVRQAFLTLFLVFVYTSPIRASSYVVVESSHTARYRLGDQLHADTVLTLSSEAELTLLTAKGEKIHITGPLQGTLRETLQPGSQAILDDLSPEDQTMVHAMSDILRDYRESTMPLRGEARKPEPGNTWQISTIVDGDQCSVQGQRPLLWRPNSENREQMKISADSVGDETFITFYQGKGIHPWPIDLTLVDNGNYRIIKDEKSDERQLILHLLPNDLPTRAHLASALATNKCSRQAAQLLIEAEIDKFLGNLIIKKKY